MYKVRFQIYVLNLQQMGHLTSDKAFLLISEFCPQMVVCPCPYIHVENHLKICIKSEFKEICLTLATNDRNDKGFLLP